MKKTDNRMFWKVLVLILKIVLAIPAVLLFTLIRCLQFFLKVCGTVVSFVCILSAVVISMGAVVEILLEIRGNGSGDSGNHPYYGCGRRIVLCAGSRRSDGYGSAGISL